MLAAILAIVGATPVDGTGAPRPPLAEPLTSFGQAPRLVQRLANHVDLMKAYAGLSDLHVKALVDEGKKHQLRVIVDMWERNGSTISSPKCARKRSA